MTSDEVKQSITAWCTTDDELTLVGEGSDPAAEFVLKVSSGGFSGSPVSLEVLKGTGSDRLTIRHTASGSPGGDSVAELVQSRPGWVTLSADRSAVQTFVHLDGMTKHSFVQAASEIARSGRLLDGLTKEAAPERATEVPAAAAAVPQTAASPAYASSTPQTAGQYQAQYPSQSQYGTQQTPTYSPSWAPTHTVPPQGARAWENPHPEARVIANLAPGLPIQVTEVRGAWARVVCSNGWTGWIDGRPIGVGA